MLNRWPSLIVALILLAPLASGIDRRSRDEPEIVVQAGGRAGTCDALMFDPSGKFLFAAGDDKVVTVWPYLTATPKRPEGLDINLDAMKTLRWPSWREQRGGIKAMAITKDGKRIAIGGYGLTTSAVAVLNREDSSVEKFTWPRDIDAGTVTAIAFGADDETVLFGTADGRVWQWKPEKLKDADKDGCEWNSPVEIGRHALAKGDKAEVFPNRNRWLFLRDAKTLLSVAMNGEVLEFDLSAKPIVGKPKFFANAAQPGSIYRAVPTPDGKRLVMAALGSPWVLIRDLDSNETIKLELPKNRVAWAIAVDPLTNRLAVGVGGSEPAFYLERPNEIWLFENPKTGMEPTAKIPVKGRIEALAFHPKNGDRLAMAGGDADEVTLFDLNKPKEPLFVAKGSGRKPFAVAIGPGAVVAVKTESNPKATHPSEIATGDWAAFDLDRQKFLTKTPAKLQTTRDNADGWSLEPDRNDRGLWRLILPNRGKVDLEIDRARFNEPTCYTFIPKTEKVGTRLLVGHAGGCSLFEWDNANPPAKLKPSRIYIGHTSDVLSVAASEDGTWFVTGGADQTVAAFSLKPWASNAVFGASFESNNAEDLTVKAVDVGSPAWECGLKANDKILKFAARGRDIYFDQTPGAKTPSDIVKSLAELANPAPGVELYFEVGGPKDTDGRRKTTVLQRPLWKWFASFGETGAIRDSVVWMWKGSFYHTETTNGDELVGWHVNAPNIVGTPRYHPLKNFEKQFYKPRVFRQLLENRDLGEALNLALGKNPQPRKFSELEPATIRLALDRTEVNGEAVTLKIDVDRRGTDPDLLPQRVELWINDYRYKTWNGLPEKTFRDRVELDPLLLRSGENKLTVQTYNDAGGRETKSEIVSNTKAAPAPNLLGLAVGIDDYKDHRQANAEGARGVLGDLNFAFRDAKSWGDSLASFAGPEKFFRENKLGLKANAKASRDGILDDLTALGKTAKADDALVLFLAGHGQLLGDRKDKEKPTTEVIPDELKNPDEVYRNIRFAFCCSDFDYKRPVETSIAAEELFGKLVGLKCRKMVFLDVCHSGRALETNVLRSFLPEGQGPFILAACEQGQSSYENPSVKHGLFTASLLEATGDDFRFADKNKDDELSCEELFNFVSFRVAQLRLETLREKDPAAKFSDQTPICYPRQPPKAAVVKKVGEQK